MSRCTVIRTLGVNVLKKYCGTPRGPKSAIFVTIDLDPLYFEVGIFWAHPTPPICLKMPKCAILSPSLAFHFKHHPNVGVYRENFLIGNLAPNIFMVFYICWDYAISFSGKFPMRKFSPSSTPSQSPSFHLLFENGLKFRKKIFKI